MDLLKVIGVVLGVFLLLSAAIYYANRMNNQAEIRAKELGCADGQSAYLSPLHRKPHYNSCKQGEVMTKKLATLKAIIDSERMNTLLIKSSERFKEFEQEYLGESDE